MSILYKFRPIDKFAIDAITNSRLYLADWTMLNDPHEAQMLVVDPDSPFRYHANPHRLAALTRGSMDVCPTRARVCSLSRSCGSNLLWSHYADGHRGVAIGFEIPGTVDDLELLDVQYDDSVPVFNPPITQQSVRQALSHKSAEWAYEREVRLLSFDDSRSFVEHLDMKEINFGLRATKEDMQLIAAVLKGGPLSFYRMCHQPGYYALNKSEIDPLIGR